MLNFFSVLHILDIIHIFCFWISSCPEFRSQIYSDVHHSYPTCSIYQWVLSNNDLKNNFQVNMMWSCTKCSFAYNEMDKDVCENCTLPRSPINNHKAKAVSGHICLWNSIEPSAHKAVRSAVWIKLFEFINPLRKEQKKSKQIVSE